MSVCAHVYMRVCVGVCEENLNSFSYKVTYYASVPHKNNYSFDIFATFWLVVIQLVIEIYTNKSLLFQCFRYL
jgi:hypothetical protein